MHEIIHKVVVGVFVCALAAPPAGAQSADHPDLLWQQATLYRDEWGVPHVYADNLRAMSFALGYAQAEDHLEPMLLAYRAAEGRLSELYGEAFVASDTLAIQLGHGDLARAVYDNADPITRELCEGFALGVNTWLLEHYDTAPPWAEGVNATDVLALLHAYLMSHAPFDLPGAYRRPPGTPSANAWATAPSRSPEGVAMLVMNPHSDYNDVFRWYEMHL
ncbi:MAG: penicillin acylase family protein, partial [Candidatus Hydrogenedentales bacterium]